MNMKPLKDEALEAYYQSLFEMFGTEGWKNLVVDVEMMRAENDKARGLTVDTLLFRQGELYQMDWLVTLQARVEQAYSSLIEEQEGESEAPTGGVAKVVSEDQ
jgi:hypothetical protein